MINYSINNRHHIIGAGVQAHGGLWPSAGAGGDDLLTNLLSYWKMDEAEGSSRVDATENFDATEYGTLPRTTGKVYSYAASYDYDVRAFAYVTEADALEYFNFNYDDDWSLAGWFYLVEAEEGPDSPPYYRTMMSVNWGSYASGGWCFFLSGKQLVISLGNLSADNDLRYFNHSGVSFQEGGVWTFFAFTHTGTSGQTDGQPLQWWINGAKYTDTNPWGLVSANTNKQLVIGATIDGTHIWDGAIGPVAVWNRVLTDSEVSSIYNSGSGLAFSAFAGTPWVKPVPPIAQYYLTFPVSNLTVNCGSDSSLDDLPANGDFTAEAWMYFSSGSNATTRCIFGSQPFNSNDAGWALDYNTYSNNIGARIKYDTTAVSQTSPNGTLVQDTWVHVALVWDASTKVAQIYYGGELVQTTTAAAGNYVSDAAYNFNIAGRGGAAASHRGYIAWVRLSNTKRYTTTFTPDAKDAPPAVDAFTIEQWNLNDGEGFTANAEVSANNNGAASASCTWGTF
jgi:hypothetical protein